MTTNWRRYTTDHATLRGEDAWCDVRVVRTGYGDRIEVEACSRRTGEMTRDEEEAIRRAEWRHDLLVSPGPSPRRPRVWRGALLWATTAVVALRHDGQDWVVELYGEHEVRQAAAERQLAQWGLEGDRESDR